MANLHVQPKRKNYAWVWILILILIIAAAAYYFIVYKKQVPALDNNAFHQQPSMQWQPVLHTADSRTIILS